MSTTAQSIRTTTEDQHTQPVRDLPAVKTKMKATWEDGDYAGFATYMEPGAIDILNGWAIQKDVTLLDIGCGSGQSAIPAARSGIKVTGIDIADNLIEHARERARYENLDARFDVGDAENLPYGENDFDVVISMIGAMFAPQYDKVAYEMGRVCRSGGRLHMANWTPDGFAAAMFRCVAQYTPPAAGIKSPALWGVEDVVIQRLEKYFTDFTLERKFYPRWTYPFGTSELVELFRHKFGPVKRAFDSQNQQGQNALRAELEEIYQAHNIATDGTTEIKGEYLNVTARKR